MINLLCIPLLFKIVDVMGCHGNCAISHNPNIFFLLQKTISQLVGPCEQFGAHEILSWERGARSV